MEGSNITVLSASDGSYWRFLTSGHYVVRFEAHGYLTTTKVLTVPPDRPTEMMVELAVDDRVIGLSRNAFVIVLGELSLTHLLSFL